MERQADKGSGVTSEAGYSERAASLGNLRTFSSFRNRVFRLYYAGMLGQMASMNMQMIANGLLLKRLTGSPAIVGMMFLANSIPMVLTSLLGGVIADRVEKKFVMLFGQVAFALISLSIGLALAIGYLSAERPGSWWILVVSSALQGIVFGLAMPSRQALINDIVGEEELMNAISLNFMGMSALQLFAPALAGFMVDKFDFKSVYFTMTGLYIMAVFFFSRMPRVGIHSHSAGSMASRIRDGFVYVSKEKTLRLVLLLSLVAVILSMPYGLLMPFFAEDVLHRGASGMGILMSVSGMGAITASLTLASLPNRKRGKMMLWGGVFLGLTLTAFAFSTVWALSLVSIALVGCFATVRMTLTNTLVQYYVEDDYRGRVMSLFMMQFGLSSFGTAVAGLIAESLGVQWAVGGFAIVLILVSIVSLFIFPRIRKLD